VYITGRTKDMIKRAGRNIYPHELEEFVGDIGVIFVVKPRANLRDRR
jgi:acyl-CoA synthetase (AMP-forming)/AMP-acid ligase II